METEALRKALYFLEEKISISEVVTDASSAVKALLSEIAPLQCMSKHNKYNYS